jgi:SAM-dependent methyltransferase
MKCQVCECSQGTVHQVREMMFGTRDIFVYFECRDCKAIQLIDIPEDLSIHYPPDKYYSFNVPLSQPRQRTPFRQTIANIRDASLLFDRPGPIGFLAQRMPGYNTLAVKEILPFLGDFPHLQRLGLNISILDIGCGKGHLLHNLAGVGFRHLEGIDPFGQSASYPEYGIRIRALTLESLGDEKYDLIMLHHSLEHMADTTSVLSSISRLLTPGGVCLIAIPIAGGIVWERYGVNWIELDAPRHLILHSVQSLRIAAGKAGMQVKKILHMETPLGFWGSELYCRDIPYHDESTGTIRDPKTVFTGEEMAEFERLTLEANKHERAGRATFYLQNDKI